MKTPNFKMPMPSTSATRLNFAAGTVVGNYRLLGSIGEGGMGCVYLAEHELLGRYAAIKLLRPEFSGIDELVARFFEEAKLTSAIDHPGVVEVHDFGYASDGSAFFVMEYLVGETLRDRLKRCGSLSVEEAFAIANSVASVLAAAHRQGVIHRDIKPENIFLINGEDPCKLPFVKVLDFGIARLACEASVLRNETAAGVIMGTPPYMSPEQCCGSRVDNRTDLYALGCVLFEMLCGEPPFPGVGAEVIMAHVHAPAPVATRRNGALDPSVDGLLAALLAKRPHERPPTADAVLDSLRTLEIDRSIGVSVARTRPKRTSKRTACVAAVAALIAAGTAGAMFMHLRKRGQPTVGAEGTRATTTPAQAALGSTLFSRAKSVAKPPMSRPSESDGPASTDKEAIPARKDVRGPEERKKRKPRAEKTTAQKRGQSPSSLRSSTDLLREASPKAERPSVPRDRNELMVSPDS